MAAKGQMYHPHCCGSPCKPLPDDVSGRRWQCQSCKNYHYESVQDFRLEKGFTGVDIMGDDEDGKGDVPRGSCYHVWIFASTGNALMRRRRCYSRSAANQYVRRGCPGASVWDGVKSAIVLQCHPYCPCRAKGCMGHVGRPTEAEKLEAQGQRRLA